MYSGMHANGNRFWIQHHDQFFRPKKADKDDKRPSYQEWVNSPDDDGETFAVKQGRLTQAIKERK